MATQIEISLGSAVADVDPAEWDACACPEAGDGGRPVDPFTTHRFLSALEVSGSVGPGTGWSPKPLLARAGGVLIGCAAMYVKSHSQGEYVFDHSWAHAYENAGGRYYPKLQIAVPFTPATGRRLLVRPEFAESGPAALLEGAAQIARNSGASSLHITFCTDAEAALDGTAGYMLRAHQQFHWHNRGYADFDAFLADLSSRKRKTIRRERERANAFGGDIRLLTGDAIEPHHWDAFWRFYQDTGARKWGSPYLTRGFFDAVQDTMRDDVLLVLCERDGVAVAGALNFIGRDCLYGRYWGAIEDIDCLHFEACYYRAIDYAIEHGLARVEAGAQGPHKLARGYLPVTTHSLHFIPDPGFARAVADFLDHEREAVEEENEILTGYGPFRKIEVEEQE